MDGGYKRPTARSRELRRNSTEPEKRLWSAISARKIGGVRFNRQFPVGPYICDFASRGEKLIIEVDGDTHAHALEYDRDRSAFLEAQGYRVLRFWNNEVMENLEDVVKRIELELAHRPSPNPSRMREGLGETIRWTRKT